MMARFIRLPYQFEPNDSDFDFPENNEKEATEQGFRDILKFNPFLSGHRPSQNQRQTHYVLRTRGKLKICIEF